jgi:putative membrane protein
MFAFWVLLIGAVVMVLRHNRNPAAHTGEVGVPLTADQLLAQRFARGEIDHEDYVARQAALRAHMHS